MNFRLFYRTLWIFLRRFCAGNFCRRPRRPDPRRPPIIPALVSCHGCSLSSVLPPRIPNPRRLPRLQSPLFFPPLFSIPVNRHDRGPRFSPPRFLFQLRDLGLNQTPLSAPEFRHCRRSFVTFPANFLEFPALFFLFFRKSCVGAVGTGFYVIKNLNCPAHKNDNYGRTPHHGENQSMEKTHTG